MAPAIGPEIVFLDYPNNDKKKTAVVGPQVSLGPKFINGDVAYRQC